jgi:hypothetical protein
VPYFQLHPLPTDAPCLNLDGIKHQILAGGRVSALSLSLGFFAEPSLTSTSGRYTAYCIGNTAEVICNLLIDLLDRFQFFDKRAKWSDYIDLLFSDYDIFQ